MICKAVIFDMDGLMFDTERLLSIMWKKAGMFPIMVPDMKQPSKAIRKRGITICTSLVQATKLISGLL